MTQGTVSLLPQLSGASLPPPAVMGLSDVEERYVTGLSQRLTLLASRDRIHNDYYEGTQRLANLGISIPRSLNGVRTVVDWPRICVDPLIQRCVVDGFRLPKATDVDSELSAHWQANGLDAEAPLCFLDSLVYGRGYMIVGSPDFPGDSPLVTVESPLNMSLTWDPRTRRTTAAYQSYEVEGVYRAVLYLPDVTVTMSREQNGSWVIENRDEHGFGEVPVVRFSNRMRAADREGRSEITPAIRNTTDEACRSLLAMAVGREFYSVPHRYVLGASESDFMNADGTAKSGLDMVMSKMVAFERDEEGQLPTVGQFNAFDPSVFTKIIDEHAQLMASYTQFPPSYFGQTSTANPASADAIRVAESGIERRASQVQNQFSDPLEQVMRLVWRFANNGAEAPSELRRLETDWIDARTETPTGTSDAITKQISVGSVPPTSDVVLKKLGYSGIERERLAQDRALDPAASMLAELATSLQAKEARTDLSVATDIAKNQPGAPVAPPARPVPPSQP